MKKMMLGMSALACGLLLSACGGTEPVGSEEAMEAGLAESAVEQTRTCSDFFTVDASPNCVEGRLLYSRASAYCTNLGATLGDFYLRGQCSNTGYYAITFNCCR